MTKKLWSAVMVLAFIITVGSAAFLYFAVQEKNTVSAPLQKVEMVPASSLQESNSDSNIEEPLAEAPPNNHLKKNDSPPEPKRPKTATTGKSSSDANLRNISFKYFSRSAKEVFIVGDFNDWKRHPLMKSSERNWETTLQMAPGTYTYLFIVDGKRTRDPFNKKTSSDMKSLLVVKPFAK